MGPSGSRQPWPVERSQKLPHALIKVPLVSNFWILLLRTSAANISDEFAATPQIPQNCPSPALRLPDGPSGSIQLVLDDFRHEPPHSRTNEDDPFATELLEVRGRYDDGPAGAVEGEDGLTAPRVGGVDCTAPSSSTTGA